jgi:CRISPR-associated RAMP protein (TIGR02581 family)
MTTHISGIDRRYLFTGNLVLLTALHIGGGDNTLGTTDSPVLRGADGKPFIPGSSLKGAFRSTVEKLAATLGLPNSHLDTVDPTADWIKEFNRERRGETSTGEVEPWDEERTLREIGQRWPATSLLFGTTYCASKISFSDLRLVEGYEGIIQRRDGVAIDRDSERAVDGLKYDFEVVAPSLQFGCEIRLEGPTELDLQLTCLGIHEMTSGFFGVGGKRSRGLGNCQLRDLTICELDLTVPDIPERSRRLRKYLLGKTPQEKMTAVDNPDAFLQQHIQKLLDAPAGK